MVAKSHVIDNSSYTTTELVKITGRSRKTIYKRLHDGINTMSELSIKKREALYHPNWRNSMVNDPMSRLLFKTI